MVRLNLLAGGYDLFIALYTLDTSTSSLTLTEQYPTGQNPSWIGFNSDKTVLYATNEITEGGLQSFDVSSDGALSEAIQTISSGGDSPAHLLALPDGQVSVTNYNSGTARVVSTVPGSPAEFDDSAPVITFPKGPTNISHAHQTVQYKNELLVLDLGADQIWRLLPDNSTGEWTIQGNLPQTLGSGPRHAAVRDNYLYTLHELTSTLTLQKIPPTPRLNTTDIQYIANVSIIPSYQPEGAKYAAAEILIPQPDPSLNFTTPYIYVTNRNVGTADSVGDSIAIFEHVNVGRQNEGLKLVNQFFTGLSQVRGIEFDPSTEYLAAAGVAGEGGAKVFRRIDGGRNFTLVAENLEIPTRTSFAWV